jgi:hypothetical protein
MSRTGRGSRLPVDPERLKRRFPELTERDLQAYVEVTTRLLADPARRSEVARELLGRARRARARGSGAALSAEDALALGYLESIEKMQRPVGGRARR